MNPDTQGTTKKISFQKDINMTPHSTNIL
jgi:hypothetical protein